MSAARPAPGPPLVSAARLVACGVVGVMVLLVVSTCDAITRGDGYDPTTHWVSLLAHGDRGWLGTANVLLAGALLLASSVGFSLALRHHDHGRTVARSIALVGASLLVSGAFPIDAAPDYPLAGHLVSAPSVPGRIHGVSGVLIVVALGATCWAGARVFDERSPGRRLSRLGGVAVVGSLALCCAIRAVTPSHTWEAARAGAFQRAALLIGGGWIVAAGCWVIGLDRRSRRSDAV